jgi:pilus assembly protein Flp/PilA
MRVWSVCRSGNPPRRLVTNCLTEAATAIEYGLIAALISVVCIAAMTAAGKSLLAVYTNIGGALAGALPQ